MSYYLAIAVNGLDPNALTKAIGSLPFDLAPEDAANTPVGRAALGSWERAGCIILDGRLLRGDAASRPPREDRRADLLSLLKQITSARTYEAAFILHWFSGYLTEEPVSVTQTLQLEIQGLRPSDLDIQEDVRYVVHSESKGPR